MPEAGDAMSEVVDLSAVARSLPRPWTPRIVGTVNEQLIKVARLQGSFVWHAHEHEDEAFVVLEGELCIEREGLDPVRLQAGQLYVVPRGLRHRPVSEAGCLIALIEPASTEHTGGEQSELTVPIADQR